MMEKKNDLSIVLNGGETQMLDATIPVKWFFSKEFIKKEPKYILLVDLNENQLDSSIVGRRYVFAVDEAIAFIQTHRSGRHIMLALAFKDKKEAISYLEKENGAYKNEIYPSVIKDGENWGSSLATAYVEFEVPKELFAQAPKSKLGKLWWKYLFWPNSPKAIDECQVRKLALFYALPKLPLFILAKVFLVLFYILYALYHIIARPISLFLGWWPITLRETIKKIRCPQGYKWSLDVREGWYLTIYWRGRRTDKDMLTSPLMFVLLLASLTAAIYFMATMGQGYNFGFGFLTLIALSFVSYASGLFKRLFHWDNEDSAGSHAAFFIASWAIASSLRIIIFGIYVDSPLSIIIILGMAAGVGLLSIMIAIFIKENRLSWTEKFNKQKRKYFPSKKKTEKIDTKEKKRLEYQEYLQFFTKPEKVVNVKNLPKTFETNKFKRNVRIKFWATKTKVCRPYEN